jgi:replicative DNA helicase
VAIHYKFDLSFQEFVLASLIGDTKFLVKNREVLRPEYFDDEVLSGIAEASLHFFDKNKTLPDAAALCQEIKEFIAPGRKYGEYKEKIKDIFQKIGVNTSYYQQEASDFARRQAILDGIRQAQNFIESGDYDSVVSVIQKAANVGCITSDLIYDFFSHTKTRAIEYRKKHKDPGSDSRVKTGIQQLDELMQGGLDKGELGLIVAPPKHGKSTALFNLGANAVINGRTTLHVSLELKKSMVAARYDSRFFGGTIKDIQKKPKSFYKAMEQIRGKLVSKLKIVQYPTKSLSLATLKSIASQVDNLGMLIVDYADLMRPARHRDDRRFELIDIYEGLRNLAGEMEIPIWTASQSSRYSVGAKVIGMDMIAECFDKIAIVDVAIALCQTSTEAHANKMRLFMMANRLGESENQIECHVNWHTAVINSTAGEQEDNLE